MINNINRRETWLLFDHSEAIGTASISTDGDPDFWSPAELAEPALYLGKMASSLNRSGEGIGALMVLWARDWAARHGFSFLRWDVWRTNPELQDYYRRLGATHVRTVEVADRWSGALFQASATVQPDLAERVVSQPPTAPWLTARSQIQAK